MDRKSNDDNGKKGVDWYKVYDAIIANDYKTVADLVEDISEVEALKLIIKQVCRQNEEIE